MSQGEIFLTQEQIRSRREELGSIEAKIAGNVEKLREVRSNGLGHRSGDAEYETIAAEQRQLQGRRDELTDQLARAQEVPDNKSTRITLGCRVRLGLPSVGERDYTISSQGDPRNGVLGVDSPLGKALLDHAEGETINYQSPKGEQSATVIKVN